MDDTQLPMALLGEIVTDVIEQPDGSATLVFSPVGRELMKKQATEAGVDLETYMNDLIRSELERGGELLTPADSSDDGGAVAVFIDGEE